MTYFPTFIILSLGASLIMAGIVMVIIGTGHELSMVVYVGSVPWIGYGLFFMFRGWQSLAALHRLAAIRRADSGEK